MVRNNDGVLPSNNAFSRSAQKSPNGGGNAAPVSSKDVRLAVGAGSSQLLYVDDLHFEPEGFVSALLARAREGKAYPKKPIKRRMSQKKAIASSKEERAFPKGTCRVLEEGYATLAGVAVKNPSEIIKELPRQHGKRWLEESLFSLEKKNTFLMEKYWRLVDDIYALNPEKMSELLDYARKVQFDVGKSISTLPKKREKASSEERKKMKRRDCNKKYYQKKKPFKRTEKLLKEMFPVLERTLDDLKTNPMASSNQTQPDPFNYLLMRCFPSLYQEQHHPDDFSTKYFLHLSQEQRKDFDGNLLPDNPFEPI